MIGLVIGGVVVLALLVGCVVAAAHDVGEDL